MEEIYENQDLAKKYESLLKDIQPNFYKNHILEDKINSLLKENKNLEAVVSQLRHEISNLIEKQKFEAFGFYSDEKIGYKYHTLSSDLARCLESTGCDLSKFMNSYDQAIKSLSHWELGFKGAISSMRSKLFPSTKHMLDFMHSVLDELNNLRAQMTVIQNYIALLELNETSLRNLLKKNDNHFSARSLSVNGIKQKSPEANHGYEQESKSNIEVTQSENKEDMQSKINRLNFSLAKIKVQRDRALIENEKLLLQLKQTKEQLALAEERAASNELVQENKIKKLNQMIGKLKDTPKIEEIINKFEIEIEKGSKKHQRTRSNVIVYNR